MPKQQPCTAVNIVPRCTAQQPVQTQRPLRGWPHEGVRNGIIRQEGRRLLVGPSCSRCLCCASFYSVTLHPCLRLTDYNLGLCDAALRDTVRALIGHQTFPNTLGSRHAVFRKGFLAFSRQTQLGSGQRVSAPRAETPMTTSTAELRLSGVRARANRQRESVFSFYVLFIGTSRRCSPVNMYLPSKVYLPKGITGVLSYLKDPD